MIIIKTRELIAIALQQTYPRGIVEDVLVKIGDFCYPADFIIMDVQGPSSSNLSSIILGRPFLSTCNALINCRDGSLKMSFGNLTVDLNIFDVCRKPMGEEEVDELCMIFALAEEHLDSEFDCAMNFIDDYISSLDSIDELSSLQDSEVDAERPFWRPKFEPLSIDSPPPLPSKVEPPKLELKPLSDYLKYDFLGSEGNYPVVISSQLSLAQECALLDVLKLNSGAI